MIFIWHILRGSARRNVERCTWGSVCSDFHRKLLNSFGFKSVVIPPLGTTLPHHQMTGVIAALLQGLRMIFGAAARPALMSAKAWAPSDSGRISGQSSAPSVPSKIAWAVSRKSDWL